jgi:predicted ester cyclase
MYAPDELRTIAMRFFERFNAHDLEGLDRDVVAEEYIQHSTGVDPSRHALMSYLGMTMKAYADARFEVDDMIAEDDKVLIRWTFFGTHTGDYGTLAPTGNATVIKGLDLWRYNAAGKMAEAWFYYGHWS